MTKLDAARAVAQLAEGNERWAAGQPSHPRQGGERRRELVGGQRPSAAILGCSDSRVPPEIIFDQGLGDLFVVRVAGNCLAEEATAGAALASLEYAALHLSTPLIVVLGHSDCGALRAAVAAFGVEAHQEAAGDRGARALGVLLDGLRPVIDEARRLGGDLLEEAVRVNVAHNVVSLRRRPPFRELVAAGELVVVGAVYDLATGRVSWLEGSAEPAGAM